MANYGKVEFTVSYVVDLDDKDMVEDARQCVFEDVMNAVKYDEVANQIKVKADPAAKPEDIPEFLLRTDRDENDD